MRVTMLGWWRELDPAFRVFLLSMLPLTELRAALPLGLVWGLAPARAYLAAVAGNLVPALPLLLLFGRAFSSLRFFGAGPVARLSAYGQRRRDKLERWGLAGLTLLVGLPLPGTGVWTGCLVAALLELKKLPALCAITLGAMLAGCAVSLAAAGVTAAAKLAGGWGAGAALLLLLALALWSSRRG